MADHKHGGLLGFVDRHRPAGVKSAFAPLVTSTLDQALRFGTNKQIRHFFRKEANAKALVVSQSHNRFLPGRRSLQPAAAVTVSSSLFHPTTTVRRRMPHRRSLKRRRTMTSASSVARLALKKVRKLERKQEVKTVDTAATIVAVSTAGAVNHLSPIAQGDARDQRDGNQVSPFFLKVNVHWYGVAAAVLEVYRTIILVDMQQVDTGTPSVLDVLSTTGPLGFVNFRNRRRFRILYDQTMTRPSDTASRQSFVLKIMVKLNRTLGYSGTGSDTQNLNGVYMLNVTNAIANHPQIDFTSRIFYND